jgi:hypothetical protein
VIWQLSKPAPTNDINTYEGNYFILNSAPLTDIQKSTTLNELLLSSFESGDKRKESWVGKFTDASIPTSVDYYFPFKYKIDFSSDVLESSTVFRLAEQYLIRAEAKAQLNKISEAQSDLNILRSRAGLANTIVSDKSSLLAAILHERQVELFTEWGR